MYWDDSEGSLSRLIDESDVMDEKMRSEYGLKAKERIQSAFSWVHIGQDYMRLWRAKNDC